MNPLYQQLMGNPNSQNSPVGNFSGAIQFQNPMQKMQYIMQAMTNPAAFIKQHFPDIPDNIQNDPNQILNYLKQSRGISDQQIQNLANQLPPMFRR